MRLLIDDTVVIPSRATKESPATQMREMLQRSRRVGLSFEKAWASAWTRVRWPHDTEHRRDWKARLEEDRSIWRSAYERTSEPSKKLRAVYMLLTQVAAEEFDKAA